MGFIKFSLLIVVSIVFVISLLLFMVGLNLNSLLYPDFYEKVLEKSGTYDFLSENVEASNAGTAFLEEQADEIVPELLDESLSYLRGESDDLSLIIDISDESVRAFFEERADSLEDCEKGVNPFVKGVKPCVPPGMNSTQFLDVYLEYNDVEVLNKVDLIEEFKLDESLVPLKENVALGKRVFFWVIVVLIICILLIFVLKFRTSPYGLRWIGVDVMIAGLVLFGLSGLGGSVIDLIDVQGVEIISNVAESAVGAVFDNLQGSSWKLFILGVVVFVVSFFVSFFVGLDKIRQWFGGGDKNKKKGEYVEVKGGKKKVIG